ncbi:10425_t:CDS:2, partial [Gigaspora margarita]
YLHKPIVAFHVVEKTRFMKDNKLELTKTIYKGNFNKLSKQMEHAILIEVLNQVSPSLEEASLHLEICIDGDLDLNKTLANVPIVSNVYANLKHLTKNIRNSFVNLLLCHLSNNQINEFRNFLEEIFHLPCEQGIVILNRTSQNKAFNHVKLVYLDKKIDYWQSYSACHAIAILYYNERYTYMLSELRKIYSGKPFENEDLHHISTIEKEHSEKQRWNVNKIQQCNQIRANNFANECKELGGFKFDKELVYYKNKAQDQLRANKFYPSFASSIIDFDITIRCICCQTFSKYAKEFIAEKIFKYTNLRSGQLEVIKSYIEEKKDTLVVIKTGGRKSFCYAASAILFDGFTIVISPLKSLIQNQVNHFIQLGIPCGSLLTSSKGTIEYESKLFDEIALGFTCLLYVTPEKLLLNKSLWKLCDHLYNIRKLQFVIDKAHSLQINLNFDITRFATIRGSDLFRKELCFSVQSRKDTNLDWADKVVKLIKNIEVPGHTIIYCARVSDSLDVFNILNTKLENLSLDVYNRKLTENEKNNVMKKWNNSQTHLMVATSAFGLGIDMPDVRLVIHYNFPMSMKSRHKLFEVIYYCLTTYECQFQLISQYHIWPEDPIPQPCNSCDNCAMHAKDKVELKDIKTEILDLLKVVEVLCENNDKPIVPLDIIDIFCLLNNTRLKSRKLKLMELFNQQKPKLLHIKFLAKLALADLACHSFVNQTIWLEQKTSTAYLTSTIIIQSIVEDASSLVQEKTWLYWIKS